MVLIKNKMAEWEIKDAYCQQLDNQKGLNDQKLIDKIALWLNENTYQNIDCYCGVDDGFYQLLLIDKVNVPDKEMNEAVSWKIKDIINYSSLDEVIIDTFPQPKKDKTFVVVADKIKIIEVISFTEKLSLRLKSIDIAELAYRNYIEQKIKSKDGVAMMVLDENDGKIIIYNDSSLFLSRKIKLQMTIANAYSSDSVVLELQRSFDYYERQIKEEAPSEILFYGAITSAFINDEIKNNFNQKISVIEILDSKFTDVKSAELLIAYGSALRLEAA